MRRLIALCVIAIILGQIGLLPWHAAAQGEVGRPPLPPGIVRLPFNGTYEITQVPGCANHAWNPDIEKKWNEMNVRAFDIGLPFDYDQRIGTEVVAAGGGHIFDVYTDPKGSLTVVISHDENDLVRSYYVHLSEYFKDPGEPVDGGEPIGRSGESGAPGEPHLHFGVTTGGDPATTGVAANINSLPGIPWDQEQLQEDGFAICNIHARDKATGGAVAPVAEVPDAPVAPDEGDVSSDSGYDRGTAVDAAYQFLNDAYEFENDSAWYVSKVLWAGGLPMTDMWNEDAALGLTPPEVLIPSISGGPGVPAAFPDDLVSYLVGNGFASSTPLDWSDNNAKDADLGDVIAYDWEGDGIVDHVAVITTINDQGYPEVSEHSPTMANRYWTRTFDDADWIESAYPNSVAYLVRI